MIVAFSLLNMILLVNGLDLTADTYSQAQVHKNQTQEHIGQIIYEASDIIVSQII